MFVNSLFEEKFEKKIKRLQNKAAKLGMQQPKFSKSSEIKIMECSEETVGAFRKGQRYYAGYREYTFKGEAPAINGWKFLAVVDLTNDKPLVKKQPKCDVDLIKFHSTDGHCDHCGHIRRRNDVLVLQNEKTKELIQIGRNCAADFFRDSDMAKTIRIVDWTDMSNEFYDEVDARSANPGDRIFDIQELFKVVLGYIKKNGWDKFEVRDDVSAYMHGYKPSTDINVTTDNIVNQSDIVMKFLKDGFIDKPDADCSEFELNVKAIIIDGQYVKSKNKNYLIWMANTAIIKDAEKKTETKDYSNNHIGAVGDRFEFKDLTLRTKRTISGIRSEVYICNFSTKSGDAVVWFGSSNKAEDLNIGDTTSFIARVKDHTEFKGKRQTVVTRPTFID